MTSHQPAFAVPSTCSVKQAWAAWQLLYAYSVTSLRSFTPTSPSCLMNSLCLPGSRGFISPSTGILAVGVYSILISPFYTISRSQWLHTSTCWSFVHNLGLPDIMWSTVCLLSHLSTIPCPGSNPSCLKNSFHHSRAPAVWSKLRSSASVVDFVTVCCQVAFQSIGPPNSWNSQLSELHQVSIPSM